MPIIENKTELSDNKIGGGGKVIPSFMEPEVSPYKTYQPKKQYNDNVPYPAISAGPSSKPDNTPYHPLLNSKTKGGPQPIIDLQVYPEPKPQKSNLLAQKQAMLPLEPFALSSPFVPPQFQNYLQNFMKQFYTPFIYKDYHINLGGPDGDIIRGSMIYEDVLPPVEIYSSYKTLRERNTLCEYIRGTFIKVDEGELINWDGGEQSLMTRLKLTELNQYNTNLFSSNPYKDLPDGFLIYKSCYPIIYDKENCLVKCNKSGVGINIRIYSLTLQEYVAKYIGTPKIKNLSAELTNISQFMEKNPNDFKITNFDVWRDLIYYRWIRDKINHQIISPNFVCSYCYFINKKSNFDFNKNKTYIEFDKINNEEQKQILNFKSSNNTMILLTESPDQTIYQWGSNVYIKEQNVKRMVQSGFKPAEQWKSIFVQMIIIFYIMDKFKFTVREMDIKANFYIKSLNNFGDNKQFWQYTIKDIDYYIPNYGHLLMFDHNFKNLKNPVNKNENKIIMEDEFGDNAITIQKIILQNAINCFNENNFSEIYTKNGGIPPPTNILDLFKKLSKKLSDINNANNDEPTIFKNLWIDIINEYLMDFIHNRVGTLVRDNEIQYVRKVDFKPNIFKAGELVIWEEKYDTFKIVLIKNNNEPTVCNCITKNESNNEYIEKQISKDLLYHYSEFETIKQDGKLGEPIIGIDYILERYIM